MFSRTYDAQRFSPLSQINRDNVAELAMAWSRGLPDGTTETIPTVYDGVMYLTVPGSNVVALDATNGDILWEYERPYDPPNIGTGGRSKTLSIWEDMVYFTAPDAMIVALDARTGEVRWETQADQRGHSSGSIVVDGKVLSGGSCTGGLRENCYIAAHDARTGDLLWKFHTAQAPDDPPGFDTWGGAPVETRRASTWGLPGSYDPDTGLVYWGIANPTPNTRAARHGGDSDAIPLEAPADLYSNSTVALDPQTGELAWYYQHLPGDDWDEDINQERIVLRTPINPDPEHVRWINPGAVGQTRDVVVNIGEGGGIWVLDKNDGGFLWASPFPFDVNNFILEDIDVTTGIARINEELIVDEPGERHVICFFNTRSYWPSAYNPEKNALYVPYIDNCLDMTSANPEAAEGGRGGGERRVGTPREGTPPEEMNGLARIDMETGEVIHWPQGPVPTTGAVLASAGDLIFWGDVNRRFKALDADTGDLLWQAIVGGPISVSTITYAVDGRQYVAVISGDNLAQPGLIAGTMGPIPVDINPGRGNNAIYVFALPE
jgi:alcohol dehydrogenase (cytochrome c)